ncbi:MAG: alkaline phosphatase [Odoribacteraceae bacterium]|jgi:predicted AlkP superfamily pyrophosphatase or phosphodiesterase|nr:alkaline phosphatase [Odoribacteraceae bacterium]
MRKLLFLLLAGFPVPGMAGEGYPTGIEHVVVIGIDGLSVAGLSAAVTPHLDRLAREGAACTGTRVVLPSSSAPNWASMLSGAGPEAHGVTSNEWRVDRRDLQPVTATARGFFPTVLDVLRARRPGACLAMFYHWEGIGFLFDKEVASVASCCPPDKRTATDAALCIKERRPLFLFAQLDEVDAAGHAAGHMSPAYLAAIQQADSLVGVVARALDEAGIAGKTLLMIISDHGGTGRGHGGNSPGEVTVPFILHGAGVKKGYAVTRATYVYDLAPTVTFALGYPGDPAWRGRAICCAFEGYEPPRDFIH